MRNLPSWGNRREPVASLPPSQSSQRRAGQVRKAAHGHLQQLHNGRLTGLPLLTAAVQLNRTPQGDAADSRASVPAAPARLSPSSSPLGRGIFDHSDEVCVPAAHVGEERRGVEPAPCMVAPVGRREPAGAFLCWTRERFTLPVVGRPADPGEGSVRLRESGAIFSTALLALIVALSVTWVFGVWGV